jgi:hypothetical protein
LLDKAADLIREVLAFLPPRVVAFLWFPVLVVLVFVAAMLLLRRLLPFLGKVGAALLRLLASFLVAVLLVPDAVVATTFRSLRMRPPAALYHYGDVVAGSMIGVIGASKAVATGLARVARVHVLVVMLACGALFWTWNHGHCPASATTCVRPFTAWVNDFSGHHSVPPAPTPSPHPAKRK